MRIANEARSMHPLGCCHRGKAPAARARGTISQTTIHSPMSTTVGSRSISSSMASRRASHISLPFFSARTLTVLTALVRGITMAASDEANVVIYTHTDKNLAIARQTYEYTVFGAGLFNHAARDALDRWQTIDPAPKKCSH